MTSHSKVREFFLSIGLLLLSTGFLAAGFGLMNTVLSLKLKLAGGSSMLIGFVAAVNFAGIFVGSLRASAFIKIVGYVNSFSVFAAIMAVTTMLPGVHENIYTLFSCRFIQGFCLAGLYIIIESWILCSMSEVFRGRALAMYMIVSYAGYSLGQAFLSEEIINSIVPFCISSMLVISTIIPLTAFPVKPPVFSQHATIKIKTVYMASPAGFIGCVISGMMISSIYSMFPIYVEEVVHNAEQVAIIVAVALLVGGVLAQYSLGALSDKIDRRKMQVGLSFIFGCLLALFILLEYKSLIDFYVLVGIGAIIGIFSLTTFPISMNLVCDSLEKSEIIRGVECLAIAYAFGSIMGPIYVSYFMKILGSYGFMASYMLLSLLTSIITILLRDHKKLKI
ncbi:MFS transporter [Candidatus Bandiella euplotis]|uniref:MFS transporter n=1 Tax=Candidatus Bandiella euplotis TaxID=1664265 RepID=A0ABZ0UIG8_9RICK|nr:MFS transporter [Candidatus Bandiella woodruffii]WPX95904.1 MFS transporter [Candidatus Bandiella woodruffii]